MQGVTKPAHTVFVRSKFDITADAQGPMPEVVGISAAQTYFDHITCNVHGDRLGQADSQDQH